MKGVNPDDLPIEKIYRRMRELLQTHAAEGEKLADEVEPFLANHAVRMARVASAVREQVPDVPWEAAAEFAMHADRRMASFAGDLSPRVLRDVLREIACETCEGMTTVIRSGMHAKCPDCAGTGTKEGKYN